MTTTFPATLDAFTPGPTGSDNLSTSVGGRTHPVLHTDTADGVVALMTKVGVDASTDATSMDYKIRPLVKPSKTLFVAEDFVGGGSGVIATRTTGTGATATIINNNAFSGHDGILNLFTGTTTTGTSGAGAITASNAVAGVTLGTGAVVCEWDIYIPTLSNGTDTFTIRAGLIDANNGEAVDGVFFRYTDAVNTGKFQFVTRSNNTETASDSGITVVAATWYKLRAEVNAAGTSVTFYINGSSVGTTTTNIPTGTTRYTGWGCCIVKSAGTTGLGVDIDYTMLRVDYTTER